tara:strand:- start:5978 stop:6325 length:348 start_codon:yes stop_codon:yes gene_type:complete
MKKIFKNTKVFTLFALITFTPCYLLAQTDIDDLSPVLLEDLAQERGMGGVFDITNNTHLEAVLTDNYASNSVTGSNSIGQGSFSEAAGVFSIIQNTGNNVIIQDSTIITVTISPN